MWKPEHRFAEQRSGLRYPSDLTDAEWAIAEAIIPPARSGVAFTGCVHTYSRMRN